MQNSNLKEILLWLIKRRQRYRVTGASMLPLLTAGDEVLVDLQAYRQQKPRIDDLVIAQHPTQARVQIIKRIKEVQEDGCYLLAGDNPDSSQNGHYQVTIELIQGRATSRFATA